MVAPRKNNNNNKIVVVVIRSTFVRLVVLKILLTHGQQSSRID